MARTMSTAEVRANFADVVGSVHYTKEPVIVHRKGRPYAVVISPEDFERLQKAVKSDWAAVERIRERNAGKTEDEVLANVTAEVEAVRQEMYGEREQSPRPGISSRSAGADVAARP